MSDIVNIKVQLPKRDTPGFLRRAYTAAGLAERLRDKKRIGLGLFEDMIEFLLPYVIEPADRAQAREGLLDASEAQFDEMLTAIAGAKKVVEKEDPFDSETPSSDTTSSEAESPPSGPSS